MVFNLKEWAEAPSDDWIELDDSNLKGGPGSGNFAHSGRPGERGGSGEITTVFHGTAGDFRTKIMKEGLKPSQGMLGYKAVYATADQFEAMLYGINQWEEKHPNLLEDIKFNGKPIPNKYEIIVVEMEKAAFPEREVTYYISRNRIEPKDIVEIHRFKAKDFYTKEGWRLSPFEIHKVWEEGVKALEVGYVYSIFLSDGIKVESLT